MSQENKDLVLRLDREGFFKQDFAVIDEILADDFVDRDPTPGTDGNREGFKQMCTMVMGGFPDMETTEEQLVAEGDLVVHSWTTEGTHDGEMMGMPATGKRVTFRGMEMWRVEDGRLAEHRGVVDLMDMLTKAGVVPEMAPAGA